MKYILLLLSLLLTLFVSPSLLADPYTLYFIRHAEKDLTKKADPELTSQGQETAKKLAQYLSDKPLQAVLSSDYRRTKQTAEPVLNRHDLALTIYNPRELAELANQLLSKKQTVLVVGHSNTTPEIVSLVGGKSKPISDEEYGELFIVSINPEQGTTVTTYHQLTER